MNQQEKDRIEAFLNERFMIANMCEPARMPDVSYYEGALKAIEMIGYSWTRDRNGNHKVYNG